MHKLKIAFIYPKRYSFYPPDYLSRGLGGTESTLVLLARALAKRGHRVDVYNCCFKPGDYEGVNWNPVWALDPDEEYDVVISLRLLETFQDWNFKSRIRAVWIHDDSLHGAEHFDRDGIVNAWIAVSETQKASVSKNQKIDRQHWFVTRNAYDEEIYTEELRRVRKIRNRVIYCGAPDRGLLHLLKMWPFIKARVPDASLVVTGSYALWGTSDEENSRIFDDIYSVAKTLDDVDIKQRIQKEELSRLQAESELMTYPTNFDEMFCISALECLAVGTPIISTRKAAMKERVEDGVTGVLIDGDPADIDYQKRFVDATASILMNDDEKERLSRNGTASSLKLNFEELAKEWEQEFLRRLSIA